MRISFCCCSGFVVSAFGKRSEPRERRRWVHSVEKLLVGYLDTISAQRYFVQESLGGSSLRPKAPSDSDITDENWLRSFSTESTHCGLLARVVIVRCASIVLKKWAVSGVSGII